MEKEMAKPLKVFKKLRKRTRTIRTASKTAGLPPGTLVHVGEKKVEKVKINLIEYNETQFQERELDSIEEYQKPREGSISWINIRGIHEIETIDKVGNMFGINDLIREDILNTNQRPKIETLDNNIFIVLKIPYITNENEIIIEQVSLLLGSNYLISFVEKEVDSFNSIYDRLRNSKGRIRKLGSDFLAYNLIDVIIDNYSVVLEKIDEEAENLEEQLIKKVTPGKLDTIYQLKKELTYLRRSGWPLREILSNFEQSESDLVKDSTKIFLKDAYDHTIEMIESFDIMRDMLTSMLDLYLLSTTNRMNEIMKTLTIIASVFIPLTFITGIYGTNFEYLPELSWKWSYFIMLLSMAAIGGSMVAYFKKKKWI